MHLLDPKPLHLEQRGSSHISQDPGLVHPLRQVGKHGSRLPDSTYLSISEFHRQEVPIPPHIWSEYSVLKSALLTFHSLKL